MNEIKIFNNPEFGEIRTVVIGEEPWFVGKDVAGALGYAKERNAVEKYVEQDDALKWGVTDALGREQQTVIINESGLYSLIFGSKLESAKKFKKWVTSEVLPSIRKNGTYTLPQTTEGKIALLAQGHTELKEEVDGIKAEVESIKNDLPILPVEAEIIVRSVKKRGVYVLGGKQAEAYNDRGLRQKLYNDLYYTLKRNFNVRTYKAIKRKDIELAVDLIENYYPPIYIQKMIEESNKIA